MSGVSFALPAPSRVAGWFASLQEAERGRWGLWLPVFMGAGVLWYFALAAEPAPWWGAAVAVPSLAGALLARRLPVPRACLLAVTAAALGFTSAQFSTGRALPVETLPKKAVTITGTVRAMELLPGGRRVSIENVRLDDAEAPLRRWVRVRLRDADAVSLEPGDTMRVRALIRAPSPPAYPGGWDLQRDAFFSGLAGSGFALGYAERLEAAAPGRFATWVQWLRATIAGRIAAVLPGADGAIATTLLTGLTAGIPAADRTAFRDSGLAHLLAVAGLHIGIVMGLVMGGTRRLLGWSEYASLHWPAKQVAALAALAAGGAYMVLTGMHVPIMRSFLMAALYTAGVLAGRRGISLRALALAATILMLLSPQEVPGVSFQMSFSAVLALIAGYEVLRPQLRALRGSGGRVRGLLHHLALLGLTSLLAGTASAPFGAYHFGHIQLYFILANMAAVPLTAVWVMPLGLLALAAMPFGLEWLPLLPMGWGIEAILWIARHTAALPAATLDVPHMPGWGLALVGFGIAWLGLWRTRWRLAALPVLLAGLLSPLTANPPDLLVSPDAQLIGLRTAAGLFVEQTERADKFTVEEWQQYLGLGHAGTLGSAGIEAVECRDGACRLRPRPDSEAALLVRDSAHPPWCGEVAVLVSAAPARGLCPKPWPRLIDRFTVWRSGAQAVWLKPESVVILSDRAARGDRPWVWLPPPRARDREP
ncbi:MAG: ComEC/Rec2 family competence protein [Acetobacteraceae bacterium]|nr:ComEC/Rec2 family competence protein [Acetobacteraceae bacterium]